MLGPAGVLHQRRAAGREITLRAIAEPTRPGCDVRVFGDTEFGLRAMDEVAVLRWRSRDAHGIHGLPAMFTQQRLRSVDPQLEALARTRRQIRSEEHTSELQS